MSTHQRLAFALLLVLSQCVCTWAADDPPVSSIGLRDLNLDTVLVAHGKPTAVLVVPEAARYDAAVKRIQAAVKEATGTTLAVLRGVKDPEKLLKDRNAVALGNMSTNPFIEKLYLQWYSLLDLKYPGKGGYVVRSVHNPYATGHNVLLLGGSDDIGVARAADAFCSMLHRGDPLQLGWTLKVQLGEDITPPELITEDGCVMPERHRNHRGYTRNWRSHGYVRYGWNPVSIGAGLYLMTGEKRYADYFKSMAMPDPENIPNTITRFHAFGIPKEPLVEVADYQAHLMVLIWDLIEESPHFTDAERLRITRDMLRHQHWRTIWKVGRDEHDFEKYAVNRHIAYAMIDTYTGSRYFAKYYPRPDRKWQRRVASVSKSFHNTWLKSAVWPTDTLYSIPSHVQFVFDFFLMDDPDALLESGAVGTYLNMYDIFFRGKDWIFDRDDASPFLYNLATYVSKDRRYTGLMSEKQLKKMEGFNLGRSFWPPDDLPETPLVDGGGGWTVYPSAADRARTGREDTRFYMACYRGGPNVEDDYLLVDGHYGNGRTPFHKNTILQLNMFGGRLLLSGYYNELDVLFEGESNLYVPRKAEMIKTLAWDGMGYVQTAVTNMTASSWTREILCVRDLGCVVVDRLTPRKTGRFSVQSTWQFAPSKATLDEETRRATTSKGAALYWAHALETGLRGSTVVQKAVLPLSEGKPERLVSFVTSAPDAGHEPVRLTRAADGLFFLRRGNQSGVILAGNHDGNGIRFRGGFAFLTPEGIHAVDAQELLVDGRPVLAQGAPVSLQWDAAKGAVIGGREHENALAGRLGTSDWPDRIGAVLARLAQQPAAPVAAAKPHAPHAATAPWRPRWRLPLKGNLRLLAMSGQRRIWVGCNDDKKRGRLYRIDATGKRTAEVVCDSELLSLWASNTPGQARRFDVVAGLRNDMVRAYDADGKEVWHFKSRPDDSFRQGDQWSRHVDPKRRGGVFCMLAGDFWGSGTEELVLGRAKTVEFRDLNGKLVHRMPLGWTTNTRLACLSRRGKGREPVLLAGVSTGGLPDIHAVGPGHRRINGFYSKNRLVSGASSMYAFGRFGVRDMKAADLDGDGIEELVAAWSGHWNEVRVYDGAEGGRGTRPKWMKYFGPDFVNWINEKYLRREFVAAVEIADANRDGKKEVVVGLKNGWIHAYDHTGRTLWRRLLDTGVRCMQSVPGGVAVGLRDGRLLRLNSRGQTIRSAALEDSVDALVLVEGTGLVAGTREGMLTAFAVR